MPETVTRLQDPITKIITEWFFGGFGNPSLSWLGHILFFLIIMVAAVLFSGIIGYEREYRGHSAGFRTHILVAVASALIMYLSIWGFPGDFANRDPARMAAQVISGIGFLGAGAIIQTGVSVKGLTTATTLWLAMAIGLACGSGNIVVAAITTIVCMIALISFRHIEKAVSLRNPIITVVVPVDSPVLKEVLKTASRFGITIKDVDSQVVRLNEDEVLRIRIQCSGSTENSLTSFMKEIRTKLNPMEIHVSNGLPY